MHQRKSDFHHEERNFVSGREIADYGNWVVTSYGVECRDRPYLIEYDRLDTKDWLRHINGKVWCSTECYSDLMDALEHARGISKPKYARTKRRSVQPSRRFAVLKRDGYRCVTCGADASTAALEVDHIVPVSEGGSNDPSNLRTLCYDCNRGKGPHPGRHRTGEESA